MQSPTHKATSFWLVCVFWLLSLEVTPACVAPITSNYDGGDRRRIAYDSTFSLTSRYDARSVRAAGENEASASGERPVPVSFTESFAAKGGGAFELMMGKVGTLDFSTPANKAIFYSGPGQGARAAAFAERTGGMTIDMTAGGRALTADPVFQGLSRAQQDLIWQRASVPFAGGASGQINAFIRGANPARTFRSIEEPILNQNQNIWRSIYHY